MLYKMSLDVQKLDRRDPTLWEMNKALVTGLNPITTQETLVEFLEPPKFAIYSIRREVGHFK